MIVILQWNALTESLILQLFEVKILVVPRIAPPLSPIASWSIGAPRLLQRCCNVLCGHTASACGGKKLRCRLWGFTFGVL